MTEHSPFNKALLVLQVNDANPKEPAPPTQALAPDGHAKHYPPYFKYPESQDEAKNEV